VNGCERHPLSASQVRPGEHEKEIYAARSPCLQRRDMFLSALFIWIRQAIKALAALFVFATLLPLALGLALGIPTAQVFGLISSTIVLQANAAFVGVGMGMHPPRSS